MSPSHAGENSGTVSTTTVYDLAPDCTAEVVEVGAHYHATVNGVVDYGVFVDLADDVSGLVHESELEGRYGVGDSLVVRLVEVRDNGDLGFTEATPDDYRTEVLEQDRSATVVSLDEEVGSRVQLEGEILQIRQTGGPTIFQVRDATGVVPCAGFEEAGVRAYPEFDVGDLVRVVGEVERRNGSLQVEVDSMDPLDDEAAREELDAALDAAAEPYDPDPLVDWPALDQMREDLAAVAKTLRRAILDGRPIRMRHHADGDGMCASVPLQRALENYIGEVNEDPDAPRHLLRRLPSKAPFYEMEDVTRDLNFSLEDQERHGQKLPLLLMLDNGSTEEDTPAYRTLAEYDIPIVVLDHHHPDPEAVEPLVEQHVNPYLYGEDYRITTGMMCVELARMIDPDLTQSVRHVPAVAGLCDRSRAEAMDDYVALAAEAGYDEDALDDVGEALDYAAFWLRYNDGSELVDDVLGIGDDRERHEELVEFLATRAERDRDRQLAVTLPHTDHERLDNGAHLYRIDVENYAHRFTYPAPGKTTGAIHDHQVREHAGDPVITIGYGPDFAVLRSDGVRLDIPEMVSELVEEHPGAGVSGGGHLVVGSIKFVSGKREEVLDGLISKMEDAAIDEDLRSTLLRE
ncbi:DHH family phosphoesterase [Halomarina ordinaria]|uniref:DHH family phosphoesterase n=1 Tax=Halomarina ordinaria TaxID=3033939 RepID=A0ABD5UBG7_9EURY|nr:OB-fold nucleic acid binding domain-containing protein [Halomarina sp. PSRA2]